MKEEITEREETEAPEEKRRNWKALWTVLCVLLALGSLVCVWRWLALSRGLVSQQAAERWQGEGELRYGQVSCFVPETEALGKNGVYAFRAALGDALKKSMAEVGDQRLWRDAWCSMDTLPVSSAKADISAEVIAVGGDYFAFHPLRLLSGGYLREDELAQDRIVLDQELAWRLFGGVELQGMEVRINGQAFFVAGVVEREQDAASILANVSEQTLYMNWDAYAALTKKDGIVAYEYLLPEPVENFAIQAAREKFPLGRGYAVANTGRFSIPRLYELVKNWDERAMQSAGLRLPYWENAARITENRCVRLLIAAIALALLPLISLIVWLWKLLGRGKEAFSERLFPRLKEGTEELFRRPARRRWEKKHPGEK